MTTRCYTLRTMNITLQADDHGSTVYDKNIRVRLLD
jgi:hypothetical protein